MQGNPTPTPETIGAQRADADLAAIAALSTTGLIERTGAGTASTATVTAFAKTLLDDADASTARGTLGLGNIATQSAASVSITGGSVTGITDLAIADGGTGASTAENARTNLGATTVGSNLFTLPNPSAITFPRLNADNSVSALNAADFRTAISAQALDSDLAAIAALSTTGLIERTGAGTATTRTTGTTGLALLATATQAEAQSVIGPTGSTGNRFINAGMAIDQSAIIPGRRTGGVQTIVAGAALIYTVDCWDAFCTGANVTGQRVQGATAEQFRYQFTGASGCTGIGFSQRIERLNSVGLAGRTVTLSADLANSLLTSVTWTAYYANTADTFGSLATPTRTQIATGTFTVNSTVTRYSAQIEIPLAAVTGIEIVFSVGAQTSGTWTIGDPQLEAGTTASPFQTKSRGDIGTELFYCQRYIEVFDLSYLLYGWTTNPDRRSNPYQFKATKRVAPTVITYGFAGVAGQVEVVPDGGGGADQNVTIFSRKDYFLLVQPGFSGGGVFVLTLGSHAIARL